jgi:receptor protein-tyrosine kinase
LTPEELLRVARRRILVVILCAVVVPASALGWSLGQDKEYTATSQLLFRDPGFDQRLFDSQVLEPSATPERQAATNILLVSNRQVAARTARARGQGLTADEIADKREVTAEGQADVISVSMMDSEPIRAAQLANTYAEEFIEFRREADRAKITEALALVDRQLDELSSSETETDNEEALRRQADQLEVLAALQTGNAELVQAAEPPDSPSSPQPVRNVVLGGVVGLLMGLGLAFLLERLDRRLRDPEEIETTFGRPILGTVPESRALGRAGTPSPGVPGWIESESFSMIRANLRYFNVGRPTRSILVTSAAPGEGKTTITWNLAAAAAAAGDRVLLIEADLRHPSLLDTEGLGPKPGLGALLAGNADLSDVLIQLSVPNQGGDERVRQMDVVPAGAVPPNPIDLLESEVMEHLIRDAEERYELVIIDTAPTAVVSDAIPLVTKVSGVIVVTRLGKSTRTAMQQLRRQLENLDAPTLGVVVNSMKSEAAGYGYGYGYGSAPDAAANGALSASPDEHQPEPIDAGKTR